jgi:hypothetical protein
LPPAAGVRHASRVTSLEEEHLAKAHRWAVWAPHRILLGLHQPRQLTLNTSYCRVLDDRNVATTAPHHCIPNVCTRCIPLLRYGTPWNHLHLSPRSAMTRPLLRVTEVARPTLFQPDALCSRKSHGQEFPLTPPSHSSPDSAACRHPSPWPAPCDTPASAAAPHAAAG